MTRKLRTIGSEPPTRAALSFVINAHTSLDRAVWSAYNWPEPPEATDDETILARLLALNLERAGG